MGCLASAIYGGRLARAVAAEVISHDGARPEQSLKAKARQAKLLRIFFGSSALNA